MERKLTMFERTHRIPGTLAQRSTTLAAGRKVDELALRQWSIDLVTLRKLGEAYRLGWLHNVMARITPITLRRRDDYVIMADLFVESAEDAEGLLNKLLADLELFCSFAGITPTEFMTRERVSPELSAHVQLFTDIQTLLCEKFNIPMRDPIHTIARTPIEAKADPFVRDFLKKHVKGAAEKPIALKPAKAAKRKKTR